jgi:ATP-dependent RNA helicase DeaD
MTSFKDLALIPEIQKSLDDLGFTQPTEIQKRAIPVLLASETIDVLAQAQTGTGKTLAFGIPLLQKLDPKKRGVQALIVAPTRELVGQITASLKDAAKYMNVSIEAIYGGVSIPDQIRKLRQGVQIVVGTPGRLNDHLRRKTLSLNDLRTLVLDEADIMLDMGFKEEIDEILSFAPANREIWLFSATVKPGVNAIMKKHMKNTVSIQVTQKMVTAGKTKQYFCVVPQRYRIGALCRFIDNAPEFYGFVFCPTKILTSEIAETLIRRGYKANALHGDLSQAQRNRIIKKFKEKDFPILVATDVAARGIDVADLTHVINYSLPDDLESYVHRIGRTGRAGKEGIAITFVAPSERRKIGLLERKFKVEIQPIDVPTVKEMAHVRTHLAEDYIRNLLNEKPNELYEEKLKELLASYKEDELKNILTAVLYDKFLKDLAKEQDIPSVQAADLPLHDNLAELFISAGEEKGVTKGDIIDALVGTGKVKKDQIQRIKIMRGHTFVVVPADLAEGVVEAIQINPVINDIPVRISITAEQPSERDQFRGRPGGRHGSRDSGRGRGRGGFGSQRRGRRDR